MEICDLHQTVLIFDEVITGFRLAPGGAQQLFGVTPDMATFGKIIGGGMPVGAYGGRRDIMECVAPVGKEYQAGTLSGNPVAMAAGIAQLTCLKENPSVYEHINSLGEMLYGGLKEIIAAAKLYFCQNVRFKAICRIFPIYDSAWQLFCTGPIRSHVYFRSAYGSGYPKNVVRRGCIFWRIKQALLFNGAGCIECI